MASESSVYQTQSKFTRPSEWTDGDRMHYLLAPFPLSAVPSLQDPKLSFWSSLILSSCRELKKPYFTKEELMIRFKWNQSISPSCLETVIEVMVKSSVITKEDDFSNSNASGWLLWGLKMAAKPVGWALKGYLPSGEYTGAYVVTSHVKEYAEMVVSKHRCAVLHKSTDLVMKNVEFDSISSELFSSDVLPLIKTSLLRDGVIVTKSTELGYDVIKICDGKRMDISDVDIGIVRIKDTLKSLKQQVDSLTVRVEKLKQSAKENIKDKKKALRLLRHSKKLEGLLEQREMTLDNLQTALHQIQMAETDKMVLDAYQKSVSVLQSMRKGLSLEKVEETLGELKEAMEDGQDISSALNEGVGDSVEWDDDELERDLAALLGHKQSDTVVTGTVKDREASIDDELAAQLATLTVNEPKVPLPSSEPPVSSNTTRTTKKQTPLLA